MTQFEELRERYPSFVYHAYHVELQSTGDDPCAAVRDLPRGKEASYTGGAPCASVPNLSRGEEAPAVRSGVSAAGRPETRGSDESGTTCAGAVKDPYCVTGQADVSAGLSDSRAGAGREETSYLCHITYDFEIPGLSSFHPTWTFPVRRALDENARAVLGELVFQLGMAETISYYKITCPRLVVIECGTLTLEQQQWWRSLYYNGLGEFMYVNGIEVSEEDLVRFVCPTPEESGVEKPLRDETQYEGFLVPVGGGKDSVVTLETLRGQDIMTYHIGDDSAIDEVIEVFRGNTRIRRKSRAAAWADGSRASSAAAMERMTVQQGLNPFAGEDAAAGGRAAAEKVLSAVGGPGDCQAKRTLDRNMLELNRQGYLNGHTPFSAIVAFSSVVAAFLNGRSQIALSNESSANESTVRGSSVNHQYSKSYEFEEDFQNYLHQIVTSDIHYYSLLRPLAEIQIAGLFARSKAYHPVFLSCNRGSRKGVWCGDCPKCLFVYIILSPFLSEEELIGIFGSKLLDKASLEKDFRELTGLDENKPFECVGTRGEVAAALKEFVRRGGRSLLTDQYKEAILGFPDELSDYLGQWNENHVPAEYAQLLRNRVRKLSQRG